MYACVSNSITVPSGLEDKHHDRAPHNHRGPDYLIGLHGVAEEYHVCRVARDDLQEVQARSTPCLVQLEGPDEENHPQGPDETTQEEQKDVSISQIVSETVWADEKSIKNERNERDHKIPCRLESRNDGVVHVFKRSNYDIND